MVEIIPAILPKDYDDLRVHLDLVRGVAPWVQIDVCDGELVPSTTWPFDEEAGHWQALQSEQEGLPYWEEFQFEMDLMVRRPLLAIEDWIRAGASRLIMQVGGESSIAEVRAALAGRAEFVIAVSLDDNLEEIDLQVQEGDTIQVMGISRVGFQGEDFDDRALDLMKHFKEKFPEISLSVDGGVNLHTIERIVGAGATRLTVGSALFQSADVKATLREFKSIANAVHQ